jgi:hypothetical protein
MESECIRGALTFTLYVLNYCLMTMAHTGREQLLNTQVAAEIRAWMGRREMNQADVARALGENEMWVFRRIRGKQQMTVADIERIAKVLRVPVIEFFQASRTAEGGGRGPDQTLV